MHGPGQSRRMDFHARVGRMTRLVCPIFVAATLALGVRPAAAECFQVAEGTKLYADVLGQTEIGHVTAPTIGWGGTRFGTDPTLFLRFVVLDGAYSVIEIDTQVRLEDAAPTACPEPQWQRAVVKTNELTWPGGGWAGSITQKAAAAARDRSAVAAGRSCFVADVPGITATVCAPTRVGLRPSCVALAAGRPVFARADASTRFGATIKYVVASVDYAVGEFLVTDIGIVRQRDARRARCPRPKSGSMGTLVGLAPPFEAMLPDGRDAGFRVEGIPGGVTPEKVIVEGRTLHCFEQERDSVRVKICTEKDAVSRFEPDPTVSLGELVVTGRLTKATIRRHIERYLDGLQYCYGRQLLRSPELEGTVQTQFSISATGHAVRVAASGLNNPDIESCVVAVLQGIEFPKPRAGEVSVQCSLDFKPRWLAK